MKSANFKTTSRQIHIPCDARVNSFIHSCFFPFKKMDPTTVYISLRIKAKYSRAIPKKVQHCAHRDSSSKGTQVVK